ncbi:2OG-Fe(II) oxygenase [Gluconacetobacter tumulicola]|uniref:2OG-Fe(II) oxygenase n=1 Tax=Gluconacetobacter tumulicola TaxID=1017177 RepID=A0A7W4P8S2_9PROT|nr:2OG-Fe(II) oxygenase [Gluconacetobacter tumulicola]MBB2179713.1 2OG-Fe(II) oxygenase [Gluconacetobacter tumulicola]
MGPGMFSAGDWSGLARGLDEDGWALLPGLLDAAQCRSISGLYDAGSGFRSRVVMARHGFGRGEYRYFSYPLPPLVAEMRAGLYPYLAPIANRWCERMGQAACFPDDHPSFLARCHAAGQTRPTPLLLRYGVDDYNCLHQDLYGAQVFPIQLAILLSRPQADFTGGEFVLTEQRPRMQSRVEIVPLQQGDGVLFAVNQRPRRGLRGDYRVTLRHGVSRIRSGSRHALGVIFHDAT